MRKASRLALFNLHRAAFAILIGALGLAGLATPAQAASGQITAEFVIRYNSVNTYSSASNPDLSLPTGAGVIGAINYACLNIDCVGGEINLVVPSTLAISQVVYPAADVASVSSSGSSRTFTMNQLTAGSSGQITFSLAMPSLTVADNTTETISVDVSTENQTSNISQEDDFEFLMRSGTDPQLGISRFAGGGLDQQTIYDVSYCVSPVAGRGVIQTAPNSTLDLLLPTGVTNVSAAGGTFNNSTNTLSFPIAASITGGNCGSFRFTLTYPSPTFSAGSVIAINADWTGHLFTETTDYSLKTATLGGIVLNPVDGAEGAKTGYGPRGGSSPFYDAAAGIGDSAGWNYTLTNNGTTQFTNVILRDEIPDGYKTSKITANNSLGLNAGVIRIKSAFGADGIDGNTDDNTAFQVATIATGTADDVEPYVDSGFAGLPLDPLDRVTYIEVEVSGFQPGFVGNILSINGEVLPTYDNGSAVVPNQDVLVNTMGGEVHSAVGTTPILNDSARIQVDIPILAATAGIGWQNMSWHEPWDSFNDTWPFLSNQVWSPHLDTDMDGVLTTAERTQWIILAGTALDVDMANPRLSVVLPRGLQYVDFVPCSVVRCSGITNAALRTNYPGGYASMPEVTVRKVDDYDGNGSTLVTFSMSPGTVLSATNGINHWHLWVKVYAGTGLYGTVPLKGYMSSSGGSPQCRPWTNPIADLDDLDQDGQTNDVICETLSSLPMPSIPAAAVQPFVKGSWDMGFASAPTSGYTAPGSSDTLRAKFVNTGTTGLKEVKVVTTFARPGDDGVVTSTARNGSSDTFPMILRGRPTLSGGATGLTPTIKWTTDPDPCIQDVGNWLPAGCTGNSANWSDWDTTAPVDPTLVTAIIVDFGMELSEPGEEWDVDFPVSTPMVGLSESEFAVVSPTDLPSDYETASASFGFIATPFDMGNNTLGLPLSKSESVVVNLEMPSVNGPNVAPNPQPFTSVAYKGQTQRTTLAFPPGGRIRLLDSTGAEVTSLTVTGVGTYTLNTTSGLLTFVPRPTYVGWPPAINYRVYNAFNLSGDSTYRPRVRVGTAVAGPLNSARTDYLAHDSGLNPPVGSTVRLVDSNGAAVSSLTIPNEGTYSVSLVTGQIGFVPVPGFLGTSTATYRVIAPDNSSADNYYYATVTAAPTPSPSPTPSSSATPTPTTSTQRTYKKTIRLYFKVMSPELTKGTKIKLARLPRDIFKAKVLGYVQGPTPRDNHTSLSKARAKNVAAWVKKYRNAPSTTKYARGISKYSDWRGRSVTLTVWYRR